MSITDELIGRKTEYDKLNRCMESTQAQLIIVYGRRRVGKTFLIHQFFDDRFTFQLTGAYEQPRLVQLRNFAYELKQMTGNKQPVPSDWINAFQMLRDALSMLPEDQKKAGWTRSAPVSWLLLSGSGTAGDLPGKTSFLLSADLLHPGWLNILLKTKAACSAARPAGFS